MTAGARCGKIKALEAGGAASSVGMRLVCAVFLDEFHHLRPRWKFVQSSLKQEKESH